MRFPGSAAVLVIIASQAASSPMDAPLTGDDIDTVRLRPVVLAIRAENPISVDGLLTEAEWQKPGATSFTQRDPLEGSQPTQRTEVWVAYDNDAVYIAARLYDSAPDSIVRRIGRRDADLNADAFYFALDSYHDKRTGYFFGVFASGAIEDGTIYNDEWTDNSWDGVWDAATRVDEEGWAVEARIPYSQLRFTRQEEYVWGVNFMRAIERNKEEDWFVMVPRKESGFASRFAELRGIRDIEPPARLEILPYVVSTNKRTNQFHEQDPFASGSSYSASMGADFKMGLGSNLTLNATVNPDFGQVEVDPAVVNLTAYETFFNEKRPFFVEGSNFLSFGQGGANSNWYFNASPPDFFYSRRVGRSPGGSIQHDGYVDSPDRTHILGAAKLTGKMTDQWSLGILQAFTAREYARVEQEGVRFEDIVEPFTSYGVVRSLLELSEGRRGIGMLGTAVVRDLNREYLPAQFSRRAYTFGLDGWTEIDSGRTWVVTGWLSGSRVQGSEARILALQTSPTRYYQRPDAPHLRLDSGRTSLEGYAGRMAVNKQRGNSQFNAAVGFSSPGFETNDMGFLSNSDIINAHVIAGYAWYEPSGILRQRRIDIGTYRNYTFGGERTAEGYIVMGYATFTNYWSIKGQLSINRAALDPYVTRGGPLMMGVHSYGGSLEVSTDSRGELSFAAELSARRAESGARRIIVSPGCEWHAAPNLNIRIAPEITSAVSMAQWVGRVNDPLAGNTYGTRYLFSRIDQNEVSAEIRVDWTFTPRLSLQTYLQPLVSVGRYSGIKELRQPGTFTFNTYGENGSTISFDAASDTYTIDPDGESGPASSFTVGNRDFNFKSLRVNAVLRWEYLPGSTLYLVWTRSSWNSDHAGNFEFGRDLADMATAPDHKDVFLVKLAYWWNP